MENAFGLLSNKFCCLLTTTLQEPEIVTDIAIACCRMHNLWRMTYPDTHHAMNDVDETHAVILEGRELPDMMEIVDGNCDTREAKLQRYILKHYCNSETGAVAWQNHMM